VVKSYREKLLDPRWQKRRLERLAMAGWECQSCGTKTDTLHVHHAYYLRGREPWEYDDSALRVLCESCHGVAERERLTLLQLLTHPANLDSAATLIGYLKARAHDESLSITGRGENFEFETYEEIAGAVLYVSEAAIDRSLLDHVIDQPGDTSENVRDYVEKALNSRRRRQG
jgi:hypothetical protein